MPLTTLDANAIDSAIMNLKRDQKWRLRNGPRLPQMLLPARFMLKEDVEDIFSGDYSSFGKVEWGKLIKRKQHRAAIICTVGEIDPHSKRSLTDLVYQIYCGRLMHKTERLLGKIGCIDLIRKQISEQIKFTSGQKTTISAEKLVNYLEIEAINLKFLDRLNTGQMVDGPTLQRFCEKLLIDIEDVAFVVSTIYKNCQPAARYAGSSVWAERWSEWVRSSEVLANWDVPWYNIYFKIIPDTDASDNDAEERKRKLVRAFDPIYNSISSFSQSTREFAAYPLENAADQLYTLGFDCWVSYREGIQAGDPDQEPKAFLTIAKRDSIGKTVVLRNYSRVDRVIYFDLLPPDRHYAR
jgi:hypothetical protein